MRKVVLLMHVSLDGFVAGPQGEIGWLRVDDELFDYVEGITGRADTALYGAHTFKLMEDYWPTAAQQPDAGRHDINHATWATDSLKVVFSKSIQSTEWANTVFVPGDITAEIARLKSLPGKDLLMLGSPSLAHSFMQADLIDELCLNINPIVVGAGIPLFKGIKDPVELTLVETTVFSSGVVGLRYEKVSA